MDNQGDVCSVELNMSQAPIYLGDKEALTSFMSLILYENITFFFFPSIVLPCCISNASVSFVFNPLDFIHMSKMHPISFQRAYIQYLE